MKNEASAMKQAVDKSRINIDQINQMNEAEEDETVNFDPFVSQNPEGELQLEQDTLDA